MKSLLLTSICSALAASAALVSFKDVKPVTTGSSSIVPGRYIVEFDTSAHLNDITKRSASPHEAVYNELKERKISFNIHAEYQSDIFIGASLSLSSTDDMASLAGVSGVVSISPVHLLSVPEPLDIASLNWGPRNTAQKPVSANKSPSSSAKPATTTVCTGKGKKQTCTTSTIAAAATSPAASAKATTGFSNLPQIQADRVHAQGNKGKGVKVAIIDGGVDYTRPALGGCFGQKGPNGQKCRIVGGYDFVGDDYDGDNEPVEDEDPLDTCYTHGSTTAGIIIAGDNEYNMTGVAPESDLYVYRVFSCSTVSSDEIIMKAMQRAFNDGVDVINLSLGEVNGWTNGALALVASRLAQRGVIVTASAGNQGQVGAWYSYSPGTGLGVINVGSTQNAILAAQQATVSTGYGPITYYNYQPFTMSATLPLEPNTPYELFAYSTDPNVVADGCAQAPEGTDLTNKILVVRGDDACTNSRRAQFAYFSGAIGILIINQAGTKPVYQNFPLVNFATIGNADGNYLISQIAAGTNPTLSFGFNPIVIPNTFDGNITSFFSEIGPTNDLFMAPSVLAPGQGIIGVIPFNPDRFFYNWTITDGTSWSSAYAAGAAALYLNAKGNQNVSPKDVRQALEYSAAQVPVSASDASLVSVAVQGAGKVQIYDAINNNVVVSPTELLLNDTANFNSLQYITLTNTGRNWVKYNLKHVPAGTALTFGQRDGSLQPLAQPIPQVGNVASVWLSQSSLTLWPGGKTVVIAKFTPPSGLDPKQFPVYSGWIQISGGNTPVNVPYFGVAAKMKDMPIIDSSDFAFGFPSPVIKYGEDSVQSDTKTYTFVDDDYPTVAYRTIGGTPSLVIDLVASDAKLGFNPNYNTRRSLEADLVVRDVHYSPRRLRGSDATTSSSGGLLGWWCQITKNKGWGCQQNNNNNSFQKVPTLGNLYSAAYIPRNSDNSDGQGGEYSSFALETPTFANNTAIPNGSYRFLMRALKITGDPTKQADYESWLSKPFVVAQ